MLIATIFVQLRYCIHIVTEQVHTQQEYFIKYEDLISGVLTTARGRNISIYYNFINRIILFYILHCYNEVVQHGILY